MIYEVKMYAATCDNCGKDWHCDGTVALVDEIQIRDQIMDDGWTTVYANEHTDEREKHYCSDCYTIGDDDELVILPVK